MRNDKRLPDAELEVMQTIWSLGTPVSYTHLDVYKRQVFTPEPRTRT